MTTKVDETNIEQAPGLAQAPTNASSSSSSSMNYEAPTLEEGYWGLKSSHNTFGLSGSRLRSAITATCVIGFSLFGYDQGVMSGIITAEQFVDVFPMLGGSSRHATVIQGTVTSCYELGCFFGALFAMIYGEKYGRRPMIIMGASIFMFGAFISIFPFKGHSPLVHFIIARVVTGLGNGLNTATVPIYQSELSKAENRGRLVNLQGMFISYGTFFAYWLDFGLSYVNNSVSWRLPIAFQVIFGAMLFFGIVGLPESPRWLVSKNRMSEAAYILGKLDNISPQDDQVLAEITLISDAVNRFDKNQLTFNELVHSGNHQYLRRMIIGASAQFFQQFTGCNAAIYYSTVLFENTIGLSRRLALVLGGVFSTVYALFTIPSFFLIDRIGRRPLFLIGAIGQGCAFTISFACLIKDTTENAKGAAVGLFLFIAFFAFTILPLPWVYPPEINGLRTRTVATSVSTCTNWMSNFTVVMFTPIFINDTRWGCYLFFAVLNFLYVPIIYFFYPESAQRSLEEIDIIFAKSYDEKKPAFIVAKELPKLNFTEIEQEGLKLGLYSEGDQFKPNTELKEKEPSLDREEV